MLFGTAFKIQRRCPFVDTYTERRTTNEHHEGDLFEVEVEGGLKSRLGSALSAGQFFFFSFWYNFSYSILKKILIGGSGL